MTIRRAEHSDAVAIATVHVQAWEATYRGVMLDNPRARGFHEHLGGICVGGKIETRLDL
jgi:hypothetical protein